MKHTVIPQWEKVSTCNASVDKINIFIKQKQPQFQLGQCVQDVTPYQKYGLSVTEKLGYGWVLSREHNKHAWFYWVGFPPRERFKNGWTPPFPSSLLYLGSKQLCLLYFSELNLAAVEDGYMI